MNEKSILESVLEYKKAYKNWVYVILMVELNKTNLINKKLIKIKIRDGDTINIPKEMVLFIKDLINSNNISNGFKFDSTQGTLTFPYMGINLKMKFYQNGRFNGEFTSFLGDYTFLMPIKGNTVIDIGANIADSSACFAVNGASKVIAFEPYKWSYKMAIENIEMNNLNDHIVMLNAAYGPDGEIEIEDSITDVGTVLKEFKGGIKTPMLTLKSILMQYYDNDTDGDLLLKMDCEGCEYNILNEEESTLSRFNKILIEYHNGYENLLEKLKKCGFSVKYTKPHTCYDEITKRTLIQGYLYAFKE